MEMRSAVFRLVYLLALRWTAVHGAVEGGGAAEVRHARVGAVTTHHGHHREGR